MRATFSGRYRQGWQPAWDGRVLEEDPTAVFRNGFKLKTGIPRGAILGGALNDSSSLLPYRLMFPLQREEPVHELRESDIVPAIAALFGNESGKALTIASWYKERHPFTEGASRENMRLVAQAATDGSVLCPCVVLSYRPRSVIFLPCISAVSPFLMDECGSESPLAGIESWRSGPQTPVSRPTSIGRMCACNSSRPNTGHRASRMRRCFLVTLASSRATPRISRASRARRGDYRLGCSRCGRAS